MRITRLSISYVIVLLFGSGSAEHAASVEIPTLPSVEVWAPAPGPWPGGGWGSTPGGKIPDSLPYFAWNRGDRQDVQDAGEKDSCEQRANPIIPGTGNKIEPETDFVSVGEMPLTLRRTYNRYWKYPGLFGRYWVSSFDYTLVWQTIPDTSGTTRIYAQRPDGRRIKFVPDGADRWDEDKPQSVAYILKNADGTYTHYSENLPLETYDGGGRPLTIKNRQGIGWTFSYTNNFLTKVTHTSGRSVQFTWTGDQLTQVTAPDGSVFTYTYTANVFGAGKHRLASTTSPSATGNDVTSIQYYYEKSGMPGALTGKAYGGVRYSSFDYDSEGRATLSAHGPNGNIDKYTFSYSGTGSPPANPPRDPPDPGWTCNTVTHVCTPPVFRPGDPSPDDPEMAANEAVAEQEVALIDAIAATLTTTETNPYNKITRYTYSDGRLVGIVGEASANCPRRSMSITYDANGYENLVTDFNGNITDYDYNTKGQLQQKIEAKGSSVARTTTYGWDPTYNRMTRETVAGDHETTYVYGADHRLASITIKNLSSNGVVNQAHTWSYTYTKYSSGIVQTMDVDGPQAVPNAGDAITYEYNAQGDLTAIRNTFGHATSFASYNNFGQPGRTTGPNGDNTDYAYYPGGKLKQVTTYPNSAASRTSYIYSAGLTAKKISPENIATVYSYDDARRLSAVDVPELNGTAQWVANYNSASDLIAVGIYRGAASRYFASMDYDELGRVVGRRGANGQNSRYAYDSNDNLKKVTDSLGRATLYDYDELNRLIKTTDAKGGVTQYRYDPGDRIIQVTDPIGVVTSYAHDGFGQLRRQASPDMGTVIYDYTASGFRNKMTRADGVLTTYSYDDIGRVSAVLAGGKSQIFEYDTCVNGKQRLCKVTDPSGALSYAYTPQGKIASHRVDHAEPHGGTTAYSYTYDTVGRLSTIANQMIGAERQFTYSSGQLSAVKVKIGTAAAVNVATNFSYEPMGPLTGFTYGNGLLRRKIYDRDYRLTGMTAGPASGAAVQSLSYIYDVNNRIINLVNSIDGVASQNYGYDEIGRLNSVTSGMGNQSFTYDANGNRTSHVNNGVSWSLGNFSGKNTHSYWTSSAQTLYYSYDPNGNTAAITGTTYTYDPFNRLARMVRGGVTTDYEVNALGQRVYKKVGTQATWYAYGPDHSLLAELPAGSPRWTEHIRIGGEPVAQVRPNGLFFVHADHVGRPESMTNASGAKVWAARNGAFDRQVMADTLGIPSINLGFPGQQSDSEAGTGKWYNLNRDYDATIGRYLQPDPIGLVGGTNPYVYVGSDPVNSIDPYGLYCLSEASIRGIAGAVVGGGLGGLLGSESGPGALVTGGAGAIIGGLLGIADGLMNGSQASGALTGGGAATITSTGRLNLVGGIYGGAVGGALSNAMENDGYSRRTAMVAGGAAGGSLGSVISGYVRGLSPASMGVGALKGGGIGIVASAVQSGLEEAIRNGNDCPCGK